MDVATLAAALALALPVVAESGGQPPANTTPIVVQVGDRGFHWVDSAIGAAAGFGGALALVGSIAVRRSRDVCGHQPTKGARR